MTMLVRRPSPFDELLSLRQAMDRLFDDSIGRPFARVAGIGTSEGVLALDVWTDADALTIEASLPGIRPEDVDITIEGNTVTIAGEARTERSEESGSYLVHEIRGGSVSRSVTLPEGLEADRAEATFENGVLTLRVPRAEQVKSRQIRITPTTEGRQVGDAGAPAEPAATPG